jgi:nucleoredoxin
MKQALKAFKEMIGDNIFNKAGATNYDSVASSAKIVCLYFSAHWCGPCRAFTPALATAYKDMRNKGCAIQIFFCSYDNSEADYKEYYSSMPWVSLGYQNPVVESLGSDFNVTGIPALLVFDQKGHLLTADGRSDVIAHLSDATPGTSDSMTGAFSKWKSLAH